MTLNRLMAHIPDLDYNWRWYVAQILWFIWSLRWVPECREGRSKIEGPFLEG